MGHETTHELLRELLNETREIRRHLERQTEFLESTSFFLREEATDESRKRYGEMLNRRKREAGKLYRRILPAQNPLKDWLDRKGLEITHFIDDGMESGPSDEIAETLSSSYETLGSFLKALVTAMALKEGFSYSYAERTDEEAGRLVAFAQRLEDLGLVRAMNTAGGQIHIEPLLDQGLQTFLSGGWLERAITNLTVRTRPEQWATQRILANAVNRDPRDLSTYEFDLILPVFCSDPEGGDDPVLKPVVIDAKTGYLNKASVKVRRNVERLGLPPERYLIVRPQSEESELALWRSSLPEVTIIGFPDLAAFLQQF